MSLLAGTFNLFSDVLRLFLDLFASFAQKYPYSCMENRTLKVRRVLLPHNLFCLILSLSSIYDIADNTSFFSANSCYLSFCLLLTISIVSCCSY